MTELSARGTVVWVKGVRGRKKAGSSHRREEQRSGAMPPKGASRKFVHWNSTESTNRFCCFLLDLLFGLLFEFLSVIFLLIPWLFLLGSNEQARVMPLLGHCATSLLFFPVC